MVIIRGIHGNGKRLLKRKLIMEHTRDPVDIGFYHLIPHSRITPIDSAAKPHLIIAALESKKPGDVAAK